MPDSSDCVFYLYYNQEEAKKGSKYGGTGFFVSVPSTKDSRYDYHYAVTNYHNIKNGHTTIRVKMQNGEYDFFDPIPDIEWKHIPGGGDVAVAALNHILMGDKYEATAIPVGLFATKKIVKEKDIYVGDDVFMVGRFIEYDGGPTNLPAARFGHISIMPTKITPMDNGDTESYCIDCHSRSGFSGSPVFTYNPPGNNLDKIFRYGNTMSDNSLMYFLGIHWAQFPERWEITEKDKLKKTSALKIKGKFIEGVSGMTCVMTPEPIIEVLNMAQFKEQRRKGDIELEADFRRHGYPPKPETARRPIPDSENPQHKEDFNSLLTLAAKKKPPTDET